MKYLRIAVAIGLAMALSLGGVGSAAVNKSKNIKLVTNIPYSGGTDIDFSGKYVYAGQLGQEGGVHIIDASKKVPKEVSFIQCPGSQNDVAVVKPGLLALGYHSGMCGSLAGAGVRLIDVSNPKRPRYLSDVTLPGGTHTLTVYPGTSYIYASPGGLPGNGGGHEQILDASNPDKLKVASTYRLNPSGCHDVSFHFYEDRKLAFCPGFSEVQIWDVSDPLKPQTIGHALSPSFFPHAAVTTPDGKYLIATDEAFALHDCVGGPTGSVWVFDITVPEAPVFAGHWGPQRGAGISSLQGWCTAHNLNFIPGTNYGVISWYTGGTSVLDVSNPLMPDEIAYYQPEDGDTWSSYWYDGRIYANDGARGLDVLTVDGIKEK